MDAITIDRKGWYLCLMVNDNPVKIPLHFIRVLTPIYNIQETFFGGDGEARYTFDIAIYPSFAQRHNIPIAEIGMTGIFCSTLPPTKDRAKASELFLKLTDIRKLNEL